MTKRKAGLSVTMEQGYGSYRLFAVDNDNDRPGDALAGDAANVALGYDITLPTEIGYTEDVPPETEGELPVTVFRRLVADPDSTEDPTTQFDLTWPTGGTVGPDDPDDKHYDSIPVAIRTASGAVANDLLSPWATYKVYYTNYEESAIAADDNPTSDTKSWVYTNFITTKAYLNWTSVTASATAADPTAPTRDGRSVAYESLAVVSNGVPNQKIRLYDLDYDQHYVVIIVGVDKAGNEGPAGRWSWATNNTIKFAVTQGVVKASSAINTAVGNWVGDSSTNSVGMAKITGDNAPKQGAMLYWMAAGQTVTNGVRTGPVSKYYDLIYRDAPSFRETGTEQWSMAASGNGANSGTSKTNWNYQADDFGGLSRKKLRFYRASYKGRWNPSSGLPLASEEVYSMNRVPLVQGTNLVALQGVPWKNTFGAVFGTDTGVLPAGMSIGSSATRVGFFGNQDGFVLASTEEYYFLYDSENSPSGNWRNAANLDVTHRQPGVLSNGNREWYTNTVTGTTTNWYKSDGTPVDGTPALDEEFFSRGFLIWLPDLEERTDVPVKTNDKWTETNYEWHYGLDWYPILKVPTTNDTKGGFARVAAPSGSPKTNEWYEWKEVGGTFQYAPTDDLELNTNKSYYEKTATMPWSFSVRVQGGGVEATNEAESGKPVTNTYYGAAGRRYTVVSLNMPVAAGPEQMNLRECGFHAGNGHTTGDLIYLYDNETGGVRDSTVVFFDSVSQSWKTTGQGGDRALPARSGYFKPNDVILIVAMGDEHGVTTDDWMWTYSPSDFYGHMPDRWMGRKQE